MDEKRKRLIRQAIDRLAPPKAGVDGDTANAMAAATERLEFRNLGGVKISDLIDGKLPDPQP